MRLIRKLEGKCASCGLKSRPSSIIPVSKDINAKAAPGNHSRGCRALPSFNPSFRHLPLLPFFLRPLLPSINLQRSIFFKAVFDNRAEPPPPKSGDIVLQLGLSDGRMTFLHAIVVIAENLAFSFSSSLIDYTTRIRSTDIRRTANQ